MCAILIEFAIRHQIDCALQGANFMEKFEEFNVGLRN